MKQTWSKWVVLVSAGMLAGCAGDRPVTLHVMSAPTGATCDVFRQGVVVGHVERAPGDVALLTGPANLAVTCTKIIPGKQWEHADIGSEIVPVGFSLSDNAPVVTVTLQSERLAPKAP